MMSSRSKGRVVSRRTLALKRGVDLFLPLPLLPFVLPVMLFVMIAIRLEGPGPIVFRQPRTGRGGHVFKMFKFRTMVPNAEALKPSLSHLNILPAPDFKILNDPRMTSV